MQNLVQTYPNLATMVTEFGQSYEGRTIRAIKVFYEGVASSIESLKKKTVHWKTLKATSNQRILTNQVN